MRSLSDIYVRCNFCIFKPENFEETYGENDWRKAMKEEIRTIEKKKT